jgi:ribitol 2-dehydrogenase
MVSEGQGEVGAARAGERSLAGKVVVITGASSGIGRATARRLSRHGVKLVLAGRSGERLASLAGALDCEAITVCGDLTHRGEVERLAAASLDRFEVIDVLFANAGIYLAGAVADGDPDAWAELVDINLTTVLRLVHAVLQPMRARRSGDIVVTSSISGHQAIPWEPVYSASKHAVQAFVHGLRRQVQHEGIRVSSVAPGRVLNEMWGFSGTVSDAQLAAGTGIRSEDVAEAVEFVLSRPRHVTVRDLVLLPSTEDL